MASNLAIVVVVIASTFCVAQAFEAIDSLPFSTQTCRLAGIALVSVVLVLVQSKSRGQDTEGNGPEEASQKKQWWYCDPTGKTHGPFSAVEMLQWYKAGYMTP